jgi:hypothetical protein
MVFSSSFFKITGKKQTVIDREAIRLLRTMAYLEKGGVFEPR